MDYSNAINDLRFLETRFKNLMEIVPQLIELGSLENAVDEAKLQIDVLKKEITKLNNDKKDAENGLSDAQKVLDTRKKDFDVWLELEKVKARDDAGAIIQDAKDKAKTLLENAKDKADAIGKAVKEDEALLATLKDKIDTATAQYAEITSKLILIKNSI